MKLLTSGVLLIALVMVIRATLGMAAVFLVLAALALLLAIYFVWSSFEVAGQQKKMGFDEALTYAMPTLAEEQKVAILRALKDLEYEREVGKISDEDYRAIVADYRARAKTSIVTADASLALGREKALAWLKDAELNPLMADATKNETPEAAVGAATPAEEPPAEESDAHDPDPKSERDLESEKGLENEKGGAS